MGKITVKPAWLFSDERGQEIDPQLFALLEAIHETGKLTAAARRMGVSYRHAWNLIRKWASFFGHPLVELLQGRGAKLTALGEKFLWAEQRVKARLTPQLENLASELDLEINRALADATPVIRIHASHGYAVAKLPELMARQAQARLDLQYRGSLDSLASLCRSGCDLAGFHAPDGELAKAVIPKYLKWLKPRSQKLIYLVRRTQGLMLTRGNPKNVSGIHALAHPAVRFVNRQRNSGTRVLFDQLLSQAGIDGAQIQGYENEEFTHAAVAAYVASGMADAGFGVEAAARQFNLDFVPVATERYFLACRNETLEKPAVRELVDLLQGLEFKERVAELPGYDAAGSGKILTVAEAFPWIEEKREMSE